MCAYVFYKSTYDFSKINKCLFAKETFLSYFINFLNYSDTKFCVCVCEFVCVWVDVHECSFVHLYIYVCACVRTCLFSKETFLLHFINFFKIFRQFANISDWQVQFWANVLLFFDVRLSQTALSQLRIVTRPDSSCLS